MTHECQRCRCPSCETARQEYRRKVAERGGPEAFNILMQDATPEEREHLMAQAQAIVDVGNFMFSLRGMTIIILTGGGLGISLGWLTHGPLW